MYYFDGNIEKRLQRGKARAELILSGKYDSLEEALFIIKWRIARFYKMPLFSPYFDERTLEELAFEAELIRIETMPPEPPEQNMKRIVSENKEELDALFDDFDQEEWVDMTKTSPMDELEISEIEKQFMQSGKFQGEEE